MQMQFRPVVPSQQSQPYNPATSQQFHHVGHTNIGIPSHSQQFHFSQPVQQLPARPGLPPPQAVPLAEVQANRPSISVSPLPLQNAQISNNYVADLNGPRMPLSSSYTFGASSVGQLQKIADASTLYQQTSQPNMSSFPAGGQPWLPTGLQSISSIVPTQQQQIGEQSSSTTSIVPFQAATVESNPIEKLPSEWLEHTSRYGKKFIGEESFLRDIFDKYITELKEKAKEKERRRRDDKAKRERDAKDREEKKAKHSREKGRGYESKDGKDGTHHDNTGENEKDQSKNSHRHSSDPKKSKQMELWSTYDSDSEIRHKRHKKDHQNSSHRNDVYDEPKEREFGVADEACY
ncbi:Pre-mRNA-processing protein like [Actinidia chinensis var. chinensis]|uniref:Pre-mRNA-processing protein like n=1 Tax=Actinidia chinensis var. chinensis TaxID=1590841 RepID=A0A2R6RGW9_ACTCC|nr:Pre-mRNA-processing protein like [Actinidia chinensis var. chinensis]